MRQWVENRWRERVDWKKIKIENTSIGRRPRARPNFRISGKTTPDTPDFRAPKVSGRTERVPRGLTALSSRYSQQIKYRFFNIERSGAANNGCGFRRALARKRRHETENNHDAIAVVIFSYKKQIHLVSPKSWAKLS